MELPPLSWNHHRHHGAAAIVVEPLPLRFHHNCNHGAAVVVVDTPLPLLLSCHHCRGAAVFGMVKPSLLLWSRHNRKMKKNTKTKKKKKEKTKTKKKKQSLRSHYSMRKESATSAQSPCRQGMCCPKSPTRHQPHPTSTLAAIASTRRYNKPD